jgi:hypothetical protein
MILSFVTLSLLVIIGAWAVDRARRYADGVDDRRKSLESIASLCHSGTMTPDEQRSVKAALELRIQRS